MIIGFGVQTSSNKQNQWWWCSFFLLKTRDTLLGKIWSLDLDQFEYDEFDGNNHFFSFRPEIPFLGKFCPRSQNSFKLKFGIKIMKLQYHNTLVLYFHTQINSNVMNLLLMFIFYFRSNIPFLGFFFYKFRIYFKVKFGTQTNSNTQNLMIMFIFFYFELEHP